MTSKVFVFFLLLALQIPTVSAQKNLSFLGKRTYNTDLSDVWGYAANGKEYALVGVYNGVSIVDVTNPSSLTQLFFIAGANTYWRDIAVWNGYAYVGNEGGGGLLIINLNYLPDSIKTATWTGGSLGLSTSHTVYADDTGFIYVAGGNPSAGRGVLMLNANVNPMNPTLAGRYDVRYVHDVFVRNDTMWSAEINNGIYSVVNIANKNSPVVMATNNTPSNYTHNAWLSDDGKTLLTTDERPGAYIASYDVSDLNNIRLLDLYRSSPGSNVIPHNVHYVADNFAVASYYRDGVIILDAQDPANLIEVGRYDTSPLSGNGFNGCWSVYPYLPSGNILASDIEQGLFVLAPNYVRACYLEGTVTDISTSLPLNAVSVRILPNNPAESTSLSGKYKTGIADSGSYSVLFEKAGYQAHTENNVQLRNGVTITLDVQLVPAVPVTLTGVVIDVADGIGIGGASILIKNLVRSYQTVTDTAGNFSIENFETGTYEVYAGKWGYQTKKQNVIIYPGVTVAVGLQKGWYDDFLFDFGWTKLSTATSGHWVRAIPVGTTFNTQIANPGNDVDGDFGDWCYVTGNGGGAAGNDDVDDGVVTLNSPVFDLSGYLDPYVTYYRWFFNAGGNSTPNDSLLIQLTNGTDTATVEVIKAAPDTNNWNPVEIRVRDFLTPTANMKIIFETGDDAIGHLVEAAVDVFTVYDSNSVIKPEVYFSADIQEGCPGTTFTFSDSTINDPDNWFWEFPGGSPPFSVSPQPSIFYANPGSYTVTLTATNLAGSSSQTFTGFITILDPPAVQTIITDASADSLSDGSIAIQILNGAAPYSIAWSTGDTTVTQLEQLAPGNYSVTVTDLNGCERITDATVDWEEEVNTGTSFITGNHFRIYPNPFTAEIMLDFSEIEITTLLVYNALGKEIDRVELNAPGIFKWGKTFAPGIYYFISMNEKKEKSVYKAIKIHH